MMQRLIYGMVFVSVISFSDCLSAMKSTAPSQAVVQGAGVIPYAYKGKRAYILLGQEFCYRDQSYRWSTFGGSFNDTYDEPLKNSYETEKEREKLRLKNIAAREAYEETIGVFTPAQGESDTLEDRRYEGVKYFKSLFRDDFTIYKNSLQQATFFVCVPYIKASQFKKTRKGLEDLGEKDFCFFEKTDFIWVRVKSLRRLIKELKKENKSVDSGSNLPLKKSSQKEIQLSSVLVRSLLSSKKSQDILKLLQLSAELGKKI